MSSALFMFVHLDMYICTLTSISILVPIFLHVVYIYTSICVYIYIYMYECIYTYIHTHTCIARLYTNIHADV